MPPPCAGRVGLSPRVRGNLCAVNDAFAHLGSIPACAGEPLPLSPPAPGPAVYPRVCGGTDVMDAFRFVEFGLSPRVRGNPYHRYHPAV